jgi:hypothetical protein
MLSLTACSNVNITLLLTELPGKQSCTRVDAICTPSYTRLYVRAIWNNR